MRSEVVCDPQTCLVSFLRTFEGHYYIFSPAELIIIILVPAQPMETYHHVSDKLIWINYFEINLKFLTNLN